MGGVGGICNSREAIKNNMEKESSSLEGENAPGSGLYPIVFKPYGAPVYH